MKLHTWGLVAVIAVGTTTQPFSCFPRMKSTPSIKPYQQRMPDTPARRRAVQRRGPP